MALFSQRMLRLASAARAKINPRKGPEAKRSARRPPI